MDNIIRLIQNGSWDEALEAFLDHSNNNEIDVNGCIVGATLMEHYQKYDTMFSFIEKGLENAPDNYELYLLLGNYYNISNANCAYLSYENALYYCRKAHNKEDEESIKEIIQGYQNSNRITVKRVSFVILSYNAFECTKQCIESIRNTCDESVYEIIIADNASSDGSVQWLREQKDIIFIENEANVGFPAGCNQCISKADPDNDIFLLNNDTVMLPNSLFWLRIGLYKDKETGATGAVTNCAGNGQMIDTQFDTIDEYIEFGSKINVPAINPYESKSFLIMFAMLIKREVMNRVGLLDERFAPGNFEDNDYGMRLMQNGYDCVLCHNCYIYHVGSKSFGKDVDAYINLYITNREKFRDKWGFYGDYYAHARQDVIDMIDDDPGKPISVLEIGCGIGGTLSRIKYLFPNADVHGIEIEKKVAELGNQRIDIVCGDIEKINLVDRKYDYILFPDVLEHLRDPEVTLLRMRQNLKDGGHIIASIPNLMNASVIRELLAGDFTYTDEGILDRTHLKFFTLSTIKNMFEITGYKIENIKPIVMPDDSTDVHKEFFDKLLSIEGIAPREQFDVFQYIVRVSIR